MDEKLKTEMVEMTITSKTSDIGAFVKGQKIPLPPELAEAAVTAKIAKRVKPEAEKKDTKPPKATKNKEEVTDHAGVE